MDKGGIIRKACRRYNVPGHAHELTFSCFKQQQFLSRNLTRRFFCDAVQRARKLHSFHVWAYVIMPEHVHLLIWPTRLEYSVSRILLSIKQSVARRAVGYLRRENPKGLKWLATGQKDCAYRFWRDGGGYDRNVLHAHALREMVDYIHNNPVRRGLVSRPGDWPWSSCRDWRNEGCGPIPLDKDSLQAAMR